jgi:hypothetical protein
MLRRLLSFTFLCGLWLFSTPSLRADLAAVKEIVDPNQRAQAALENADASITKARKALEEGRDAEFLTAVEETERSVEFNWESLQASGKIARKSPRWYKWSEQRMAPILRRIDSLVAEASGADRERAEQLKQRVSAAQDRIIEALFAKKKK